MIKYDKPEIKQFDIIDVENRLLAQLHDIEQFVPMTTYIREQFEDAQAIDLPMLYEYASSDNEYLTLANQLQTIADFLQTIASHYAKMLTDYNKLNKLKYELLDIRHNVLLQMYRCKTGKCGHEMTEIFRDLHSMNYHHGTCDEYRCCQICGTILCKL